MHNDILSSECANRTEDRRRVNVGVDRDEIKVEISADINHEFMQHQEVRSIRCEQSG